MFHLSEKNPSRRDSRVQRASDLNRRGCALIVLTLLAGTGCANWRPFETGDHSPPLKDIVVYHRAETERADQLSLEVERLRTDLRRAEEVLVSVESGLRGNQTRASAVSELAEARILVRRAAQLAPWRVEKTREAESKLAEADHHVQQNNPGAALFFVYRARRIAELGLLEARFVSKQTNTYFVGAPHVNLRAGPTTNERVIRVLGKETPVFAERKQGEWMLVRVISGSAGWIHRSLIRQ